MTLMLLLAAGVALAVTKQCQADVDCFGTRRADTLNGSAGADRMYGKGRGDTLNAFGGNDYLYGQGGADKLFGGSDLDHLTGGTGNDTMSGEGDPDRYYFGEGWGKDTIADDQASANELIFRSVPSSNVFITDDLIINLTSGTGPEVTNTSGTNTINWEGNVIIGVSSGTGDDQITGNALGNDLFGHTGADTISGEQGNDFINVQDGAANDTVDCGEPPIVDTDNDHVLHDPGDDIAPNCEVTSTAD